MIENKRFTTDNGSNEDVTLVDNLTGNEYESNFEDIVTLMNDLNCEMRCWKNIAVTQSDFNQILLKELDIAVEQGYEVSDPFKKFMAGETDD